MCKLRSYRCDGNLLQINYRVYAERTILVNLCQNSKHFNIGWLICLWRQNLANLLLKVLTTDNENERTKLIYGLKNQIAKAGKYVGEEAVQLHGGMGVTEEMSVGHYLKRLLVITNLFGSSDYFLDKYIES